MSSPRPNPSGLERPVLLRTSCALRTYAASWRTLQAFDDSWLVSPVKGEVFESGKACLARLQEFALSRGFAVMTLNSKTGRFRFGCIHYRKESKNWRKLEQHVEKDPESKKTVSKRQREATSKQARGCDWEMYRTWRSTFGR